MQQFTLSEAAAWTGGTCTVDPVITSVVRDAREAGPGSLFVAIKGERFDGHDFIGQAIERGAAAVLTHRKDETYSIPALYVEDTRQGLLDLAGGYRAQFDCPVVAVTGSVGKTTTKEMIASVLSERYDTLKTQGNLNNTIGMPLTALEMDENTEAAVFEMGMSAFGEIAAMAACGQPNIAVITMIGTSHIEFLGSREGICRAKMEILEGLAARGGIAVLNGDEPLLWEQKDRLFGRIVWFGQNNPGCEFRAEDISCTDGTLRFTLIWPEGRKTVEVASQGTHNVGNALAAAACGWLQALRLIVRSACVSSAMRRTALPSIRTATTQARTRWKPRCACSVRWRVSAALPCSAAWASWATTHPTAIAEPDGQRHSTPTTCSPTARTPRTSRRVRSRPVWTRHASRALTRTRRWLRHCARRHSRGMHCCSRAAVR